MILQQQGLSERRAVKKLVADPKKRKLFPYRQKGHFASAKDLQNREDALWARLQKIKVRGKSFADLGYRISPIELIPGPINQNPCAQWRNPMDIILQGWSTSLFHASQQWSTRSS